MITRTDKTSSWTRSESPTNSEILTMFTKMCVYKETTLEQTCWREKHSCSQAEKERSYHFVKKHPKKLHWMCRLILQTDLHQNHGRRFHVQPSTTSSSAPTLEFLNVKTASKSSCTLLPEDEEFLCLWLPKSIQHASSADNKFIMLIWGPVHAASHCINLLSNV